MRASLLRQYYQITWRDGNTQAKQEKGHNYIYNVRAITHRIRHTAVNHCIYKQSAINNYRYDQAAKRGKHNDSGN